MLTGHEPTFIRFAVFDSKFCFDTTIRLEQTCSRIRDGTEANEFKSLIANNYNVVVLNLL